jgi:zinc protease
METAAMERKIPPPPPGKGRETPFPPVHSTTLRSGLVVDLVEYRSLPVLYLRLVIDTYGVPASERAAGLRRASSRMLREGTSKRSSAEIADAIEFVGGDMGVETGHDNVTLTYRVLVDHAPLALELLSEIVREPSFPEEELEKYKRREIDRLTVSLTDPNWLASRAFYGELYAQHPYAVTDITPEAVRNLARAGVAAFHGKTYVGRASFLVAVGDVDAAQFTALVDKHFGDWAPGAPASATHVAPPARKSREIVLVDRPSSVQSVIYLGNLALRRKDDDYIPLRVANQVLGATASSRLFLDLREKRSLTYGAYSRIDEMADVSPFRASASVRNEVTGEALGAFFENIERWRKEPATPTEMTNARTYLTGVMPIYMETPSSIASMIAVQRSLGLPGDYWSTYRAKIDAITAEHALAAAAKYVHPDQMLVVVVGKASAVEPALQKYGPVRVVPAEQ